MARVLITGGAGFIGSRLVRRCVSRGDEVTALDDLSRVGSLERLRWLRDEFGEGKPPLWSVALQLEAPTGLPPEWCEEDSILGDYLRVVQQYETDPARELALQETILEGDAPPELGTALALRDAAQREQVLREAALLGADLLRGDEGSGH